MLQSHAFKKFQLQLLHSLQRQQYAILRQDETHKNYLANSLWWNKELFQTPNRQLHEHQGHQSDCNFITRLLYKNSY